MAIDWIAAGAYVVKTLLAVSASASASHQQQVRGRQKQRKVLKRQAMLRQSSEAKEQRQEQHAQQAQLVKKERAKSGFSSTPSLMSAGGAQGKRSLLGE